ncbi:MAG: SDR family NAD(P)-dependent oxidoreductase, partial [Pseudomonadota bacterium]|nr:SDR family NAD(P)-dependent oxidoreductase [Pseudomonadota bacterium]
MNLDGKVAAVTGGSAGIGRGIAEAYLAEGAAVAIMARNATKAQKTLDEVGAAERLIFIQGDAMQQDDVENFVDKTAAHFGQLDILVNNAGGAGDLQPTVDLSDEAFDEAMKWNVYSTFWGTRRALKLMIPQNSGRIINISSIQ